MADYIVRATAADNQIRAFAITSKELVETARQHHDTTPVATAALGRLLTGTAMMGVMMKSEDDLLTVQIQSSGPIKAMTVTADSKGNVKGFASNPYVDLPTNAQGKLDVGTAVGIGVMNVIKDMGLKEPYVGQTVLQTGEIADDLTYYFASSEQVPSSVALGVLIDRDKTVRQAGGFIIQLMPFTDEDVIDRLEKKIASIDSITSMLEKGMTPEEILEDVLGEFGLEIMERTPAQFHCDCSKEKVSKAIISLGKKEIQSMIDDGKTIEVNCHFCNTHYNFEIDELKEMLK